MKTVVVCLLIAGALAAPSRKPTFRRDLNRIVGGQDATPGQFPYQLSLQDISFGFGFHICGASIYTENRAISAAHCVEENVDNFEMLQIVAGEHNFNDADGYEQTTAISKIILYDDYDYWKHYDISIIYLSQTLKFNERVQAIPLQSKKEYEGNCVVSGWGTTEEGGTNPSTLQYVQVPTITDYECDQYHAPSGIEDSMICAGYPEGGKDFCDGDDGGPLVCDGFLTGIVSWSYGCARYQYPGVYTEVAYYKTWIEQNAK